MTLENCKKLYKFYTERGDKKNAAIFAERIKNKGGTIEEPKKEAPKPKPAPKIEVKEDGKQLDKR